ncbi:aminotransferase class I/II-fold pyridoxal phosphate-dependent enzyme [Paremcibacter congregatus]|uniref:Aminotransferase n=1 Tax=Paremcibacter congregatus TaxID=2043170 RepID=A0A2G4YVU2_9PROT|nr:aminotransferase class I/II-fold pyridoxal phosphate-dependent enzyme [Paremcibacter congregatus]PHZ86383.1 aspartate aminotransferase [Paremcibacter congregatus]QDE28520.1 aminotransferase class I/II-fold pyridoxal phosphate-dependent enzyme [Paremcibacter congregatus]
MKFRRMPIEAESPEQLGYDKIKYNLAESSVSDRFLSQFTVDFHSQLLCYGDHIGHPGLRDAIAEDAGSPITIDNILITTGAATALFIISTTPLEKNDHMIVVRPNYATNIETPRTIGCDIDFLDLSFEDSFQLNINKLRSLIRPETKLISLTTPHNPTGVCLSTDEILQILSLLEDTSAFLLIDETYGDMYDKSRQAVAATLSDRLISVSSLSKSYAIPGIRIGWLITQNSELFHMFLCAKEQINICGSVIDEEIAFQAYTQREIWQPSNNKRIARTRNIVKNWIELEPLIEWVEPNGGCVCFPRLNPGVPVSIESFYKILNERYETYVGQGHWFEMPKNYFRIGYAWPEEGE